MDSECLFSHHISIVLVRVHIQGRITREIPEYQAFYQVSYRTVGFRKEQNSSERMVKYVKKNPDPRYLHFHIEIVHQLPAKSCKNGHHVSKTFPCYIKYLTKIWKEERAHLFPSFHASAHHGRVHSRVDCTVGLYSDHPRGWRQRKSTRRGGNFSLIQALYSALVPSI